MTVKSKLDPETKIELLIKLAFGIPMNDLIEEYQLSSAKIINLRKNNYLKYNEFFEYWKIDKDVAKLCLPLTLERELSIVKKFYKNNCKIITHSNDSDIEIVIKGVEYTHTDIMKLADSILQKDNINNFIELAPDLTNYY